MCVAFTARTVAVRCYWLEFWDAATPTVLYGFTSLGTQNACVSLHLCTLYLWLALRRQIHVLQRHHAS